MYGMASDPVVSVIVPVYNAQDYVGKCLDSILAQSYEFLEIIVVDDGSDDSSASICDSYAMLDKRIKVIHKTNGGLSDARNTGIEASSGDLLTFVDSDDYVSNDYIWRLLQPIACGGADIAVCGLKGFRLSENGEELFPDDEKGSGKVFAYSADEALRMMLYQVPFDTEACAKMFRRELLEGVRFPAGRYNEDLATVYKLFIKAENAAFVDAKLYYYLLRSNSIMGSRSNTKRYYDSVEIIQKLSEEIALLKPQLIAAAESRALSVYFQSFAGAYKCGDKNLKENCWKMIRTLRAKVLFDPQGRPKARVAAMISYLGQSAFLKAYNRFVGK